MAHINPDKNTREIIDLLASLVAIPTHYPPGNSSKMAAYLVSILEAAGYETEVHASVEGMDNVVARIGRGAPSLVLNAHVDTVDAGDKSLWHHNPHTAVVENGLVYGLGAANCKGSAAVQLWLARQIARRGDPVRGEIVFTFVTDEESLGPNGMAHLREIGAVKPDMLLLGAPTDNTMITTERGVLWSEIVTSGEPAHAGQPQDGDNAILRMIRILNRLDAEMTRRLDKRIDGALQSTMNIGKISGGRNTNVVPSRCIAEIDRRLLPSESVDAAFNEMQSIIKAAGEPHNSVTLRRLRGTNGFRGDDVGPLVDALKRTIESRTGAPAAYSTAIGVSDGRYFADDGIEIVNFGPGIGSDGHASNESVSVAALVDSAMILRDMVDSLYDFLP